MLLDELEELGLSKEEAKVYVTVLELGGSCVSVIAKRAGVNRVACYHTLSKLRDKELISSLEKNRIKYFTAEPPQTLVNKQRILLNRAQEILPELLTLKSNSAYSPKIHYYEGSDGIKKIFEDMLTSSGEILGYTNLENLPNVLGEKYLADYARRKINQKIKTRMLSPISEKGLKYTEKYYPKDFDQNLVEILFINKRQFWFEYEINIYGDKVAIISLNSDELIGLIIESSIYANTQRGIFNLAWLGATSFVAK
ncbi:MAG: helix-turn-helix domain-containing protein [Patescibacteria group bacterium]